MLRVRPRPAAKRPARPQRVVRPRAADIAPDGVTLAAIVADPDWLYVFRLAWECHANELGAHDDRTTRAELIGLLAMLEMKVALEEKARREGGAA